MPNAAVLLPPDRRTIAASPIGMRLATSMNLPSKRGGPLAMSRKTKRPDTMSLTPFTASHPVKPVDGDGELGMPKSCDAAAGCHRKRDPMYRIPTAIRPESNYPGDKFGSSLGSAELHSRAIARPAPLARMAQHARANRIELDAAADGRQQRAGDQAMIDPQRSAARVLKPRLVGGGHIVPITRRRDLAEQAVGLIVGASGKIERITVRVPEGAEHQRP
jgi:hypothetical protein